MLVRELAPAARAQSVEGQVPKMSGIIVLAGC